MRQRDREEEQRREEERIEAEEVRRLAAEFAEEQRRKAAHRRDMAVQQAGDNKRQIEDVELVKQIDRMQEEVVDFAVIVVVSLKIVRDMVINPLEFRIQRQL